MTGQPSLSYLICSTPRSGSTLLCEMLAATGVAGRPEEYFQELESTGCPRTLEDYMEGAEGDVLGHLEHPSSCPAVTFFDPRRFGSFESYVSWVLEAGTTPNGVFAAKIMRSYLDGLMSRLRNGNGRRRSRYEVLSSTFPNLRHVWLRRRDKARQAVSLWRAIQTGVWRRDALASGAKPFPDRHAPLRFSFEAIDHLRRRLAEEDACWEDYFVAEGLEPLVLTYEEMVTAHADAVDEILSHIEVEPPARAVVQLPGMVKQADELSERWVSRYEEMAAEMQQSVA